MFILHIALQGCLRARDVQYGITADTGGHIRYVLELAEATSARPDVTRVEIATRRFSDAGYDPVYAQPREQVNPKCDIVRFATPRAGYLAKEQLWSETRAYATALAAYLMRLPAYPDIVHAHYADAGQVAVWLHQELGIPFVFTAHSLGRLKQMSGSRTDNRPVRNDLAADTLLRRIGAEEATLADANLVIASSQDEARHQLGLYDNHDPQRICVMAPGCSLDTAVPPAAIRRITGTLHPHLRQHGKPPVLALARPVQRKNLTALAHAFGSDPRLPERANLVIFAGSENTHEATRENAAVREELRCLIDRYELHGHVALPDGHAPGDVGAIYHWAATRGGVFANVAFSEPFGLTLIEAARFGLPLVATNRGGPSDILGEHDSGILVDPQDVGAIGDALWHLLSDRQLWFRYSAAAARSTPAFDWSEHAKIYVKRLRALLDSERSASWRRRNTA